MSAAESLDERYRRELALAAGFDPAEPLPTWSELLGAVQTLREYVLTEEARKVALESTPGPGAGESPPPPRPEGERTQQDKLDELAAWRGRSPLFRRGGARDER